MVQNLKVTKQPILHSCNITIGAQTSIVSKITVATEGNFEPWQKVAWSAKNLVSLNVYTS